MRQFRLIVGTGLLTAALAAGMTIASASLAVAQSNGTSRPAPSAKQATPPAAAGAAISDQELKIFAIAALEVKKINDSYRPRYRSADTPAA